MDSLVLGVLMVTALSAFAISFLAYLRARTTKLLLVTIAILMFVLKASLMVASMVYNGSFSYIDDNGLYLLFDIAVVALIMLSGLWE